MKLQLTILFLIGSMFPVRPVSAEDTGETPAAPVSVNTDAIKELLDASRYPERWRWNASVPLVEYPANDIHQSVSLRFQDNGRMARAKRLRSLSLLTLAESQRSRLFLGVNEEGMLGVHFRALASHRTDQYLVLARMPYLDDRPSDTVED